MSTSNPTTTNPTTTMVKNDKNNDASEYIEFFALFCFALFFFVLLYLEL